MPATPVPKSFPVRSLPSMRSVRPTWVPLASLTLIATRSSLSPSITSLPARPVKVSLPPPPSRMSPSPHTLPVSGQLPEADRSATAAAAGEGAVPPPPERDAAPAPPLAGRRAAARGRQECDRGRGALPVRDWRQQCVEALDPGQAVGIDGVTAGEPATADDPRERQD